MSSQATASLESSSSITVQTSSKSKNSPDIKEPPISNISPWTNKVLRTSLILNGFTALLSIIVFVIYYPKLRPSRGFDSKDLYLVMGYIMTFIKLPCAFAKNPLFMYYRSLKSWSDPTPDRHPDTGELEALCGKNFFVLVSFDLIGCIVSFVIAVKVDIWWMYLLANFLLLTSFVSHLFIRRYNNEFLAQFETRSVEHGAKA